MHRSTLRLVALGSVILALLGLIAACAPTAINQTNSGNSGGSSNSGSSNNSGAPDGDRAKVEWVYDGDTIEVSLNGRKYDLRYIGVDTPERDEPFYQEAFEFNMDLVRDETVILVKDVSETDQYGRLLRYVYLPDGTFVNAELIKNGWARLVTFPPDVDQTEYFDALQDEAREEKQGMWANPILTGPCDCDRNLYDCRDFDTQGEAQVCYDYCQVREGEDVHHLDGGGDGIVCESLPRN